MNHPGRVSDYGSLAELYINGRVDKNPMRELDELPGLVVLQRRHSIAYLISLRRKLLVGEICDLLVMTLEI